MSLLAFENVSKSYGATPALENVSLDIPAGKIVGLLGPNGSGKTTLIKLINGLLQPDQGRVLINDMDPSPVTKAIVAYLPDTTYLNEQMKVKEALTYFKTFYKAVSYTHLDVYKRQRLSYSRIPSSALMTIKTTSERSIARMARMTEYFSVFS